MHLHRGDHSDKLCGVSRFSSLNLYPKNWTFPCAVDNYEDFKVRQNSALYTTVHLLDYLYALRRIQYLIHLYVKAPHLGNPCQASSNGIRDVQGTCQGHKHVQHI